MCGGFGEVGDHNVLLRGRRGPRLHPSGTGGDENAETERGGDGPGHPFPSERDTGHDDHQSSEVQQMPP